MTSADPALMRAINRFQVMDAIRRHGPISRVEIVDRTELSPTTVSAITSTLLGDDLIISAKNDSAKQSGRSIVPREFGVAQDQVRGRPRVMLALNPEAAFVVGVKLASDQITIAATDFRADVLQTLSLPVSIVRQSTSFIADTVKDGILRCVSNANLSMKDIRGVCLGLPGVIERASGTCLQSPLFEDQDVPLAYELEKRLSVTVSLDADANLITLAESWFGQAKGEDDFMVASVERSLGLGIMHRGELFRGTNDLSPDLGDLLVYLEGETGTHTLSDVASVSAMLNAAGIWGNGGSAPDLTQAMAKLVGLANEGDVRAKEILSRAGRGLGAAIASLTTLFAPSRVILAGIGVSAGEHLLGPLRETVAKNTPASMRTVTQISIYEWTDDTWARGAAAMMLRDLYGMPWEAMAPVMRI